MPSGGRKLRALHLGYEAITEWPLVEIENKNVPYSQRVSKMRLSADRRSIVVNNAVTLDGIPEEAFEYQLGARSAIEWIIDQYQIKGDSDPNQEDDPAYIMRLIRQVVAVSIETVKIVNALPAYHSENVPVEG